MRLTNLTLVLCLAIGLGCQYKYEKTPAGGGGDSGDVAGDGNNNSGSSVTPGFADVRSQILAPKCLECHSSAGGNRGGINLETYANAKRMGNALVSSVANDFMPLNRTPLTAAEKRLLTQWVQAGAPENPVAASPAPGPGQGPAPAPAPDLDPSNPEEMDPSLDWATVSGLVIEPSCVGCHSNPSNKGGVNLETYRNTLRDLEDVKEAVEKDEMPLRSSLTAQQKKLILDWIAAGAPEFSNP